MSMVVIKYLRDIFFCFKGFGYIRGTHKDGKIFCNYNDYLVVPILLTTCDW